MARLSSMSFLTGETRKQALLPGQLPEKKQLPGREVRKDACLFLPKTGTACVTIVPLTGPRSLPDPGCQRTFHAAGFHPRRSPSVTIQPSPLPLSRASACAETFFMRPAQRGFLALLVPARPVFLRPLPGNRERRQPGGLPLRPVLYASAFPETKNPLPPKSDRGQRVKQLWPVRPCGR